MSFEEFIQIEKTLDVGENDLVPVSILNDEVCTTERVPNEFTIFFSSFYLQITQIQS